MKVKFIFSISFLFLFAVSPILAAEPFPAFPMSFYGTASLNGSPLGAGTKIQAYAGNDLAGEVVMPENGIYGYNNPTRSRLVVGEYSGDLVFKYFPAGAAAPLSGDRTIKFLTGFVSGESIELNLAFTKAAPPAPGGGSSSGSGSGGSGGGSSSLPPAAPAPAPANDDWVVGPDVSPAPEHAIEVLGEEYGNYHNLTSLYGVSGEIVETVSQTEADEVNGHNTFVAMDNAAKSVYDKIIKNYPGQMTDKIRYSVAYLIQNGTQTIRRLGAGERGGALNSYISAFGKMPQSLEEWQDVIKIGNGRWPAEKSETAETRAKAKFKAIYLRDPDMNNPHDNAAVTVIAYGLRPANRNMESEKNAVKIFKGIFKYEPASAIDWDMVRAIAYSGAVR